MSRFRIPYWLKRLTGFAPAPRAVYIDRDGSRKVRYELTRLGVFRRPLRPRMPDDAAVILPPGLKGDRDALFARLELFERDRDERDQQALDSFLAETQEVCAEFELSGAPAYAPFATPGTNEVIWRKGWEFVTTSKLRVRVNIGFNAPLCSSAKGAIPVGVRFRIIEDGVDYTKSTACDLLEPHYSELESQLVPKAHRDHERYAGYSLSLDSDVILDHCQRITSRDPEHD